ncbi:MAG: 3-oxoacyl-ACP synthase III family protein [Nostoc sp. DedQUE08]|uniref:3-oxoacyl-ACP synthase III family protein n=1 Tax=unclassified Nostoc TaxID=2593658 RepID=UPI002AD36B13|nr:MULTISPECIES: 3-oxoacyl-ACP synthase III family protein [unclassified Nostoc]MDZ8069331.1 3-oxoacyl-ACP synthase III family protein [Nostoc sp. DedQUE08]MDZ8095704.1 3-oxoacyl-ACP synthase III family protein [Nostoc sp. DedQUE05]MDZ8130277.1 3-oxoacyl-ACP synthase III family protein [Nostoc sp. DedQUE07]
MTHQPVGIRSVALNFPSIVRTNDYWQQNYPELVTEAESRTLAKLFKPAEPAVNQKEQDLLWSEAIRPYLSDPFRGTVERRVLAPGETSLALEYGAARSALEAAELSTDEVDLMIVTTLFPEQIAPGNASYLARKLGLNCPAWNLESTCSSALVAMQNASALVQTGEYRNVLVVISCIYSHFVDEDDTLSWFMADGAGAFLVSTLKPNQGVLGTKIVHTQATCGAFFNELVTDANGLPRMRIQTGESASKQLGGTSVHLVRTCCEGAIASAGVSLDDIKFFAFNTPTAWYANLCARSLGIDPDRTINLYPYYANIGPVLPIANLYYGAQSKKIRENDLVLVYTIGSASTAAATVMRWGEVKLGTLPASAVNLNKSVSNILTTV